MNSLIDYAFDRSRTTLLILCFLLIAGVSAYIAIPKESEPDIDIPNIYVSMSHEGISPQDAERLLIRPMEKQLQSIEGIKQMSATAEEGYASVMLEFDAGFDAEKALQDVREKVDIARADLPADSDEPSVQEVNVALFPVLTVVLSGSIPERTLVTIARELKNKIESLSGVLEVDIGGDREDVVDVIVDPTVMDTYNLSYVDILTLIQNNNRLVAAGAVDNGSGRFVIKVPGMIESLEDIQNMPIKIDGDRVVTIKDVAEIRSTFKDPQSYARVAGEPAIALEISKRLGENIIETIEEVKLLLAAEKEHWPSNIEVSYLQDKSKNIRTMLEDLQNNVLSAVFLVMIVIIAALGVRPAILVGIAIPGSFLAGILVIYNLGYSLNIVSLFSLILVVGMLVDGAIVVTELADRKMLAGIDPRKAYADASKRMAWPIIASTATTLVVFMPLLFWPGVVGEFMKYLPITVIACLTASLVMALIFVPVLGAAISRKSATTTTAAVSSNIPGTLQRSYIYILQRLLRRPAFVLLAAIALLIGTYAAYGTYGRGIEFFPEAEPDFSQVQIHARGDLSITEKDDLVKQVEVRLLDMPELKSVYSRTLGGRGNSSLSEDVIGVIQLEFIDWQLRRTADQILQQVKDKTADIPGVIIETRKQEGGPVSGKPVELIVSARDPLELEPAVEKILAKMRKLGDFTDIEDTRALPGNEWQLTINRSEAARYGVDVVLLGNAVKLVTNGIKVADYRPDSSDEEVDIRVRFPRNARNLDQLKQMRVNTKNGAVPMNNFVQIKPVQKTGTLHRVDEKRTITIKADVTEGTLVNDKLTALRADINGDPLNQNVQIDYKGQDEDQRETMAFLTKAFVIAVFLMAILLVTQFNNFYHAILILTAIVFSTAGVLIGLLVTGQTFGIVMCGIGVIALAGIVVNNNIILIDTYNAARKKGLDAIPAAIHTGAKRLRPVLLTSSTTILGLLPMVLAVNFDFVDRSISVGAPSTQWWTQLSSAVAGGLAFATLLTLILTPCLLVLGESLLGARDKEPVIGTEGELI